ncbi:hypothetical protein [Amycolatopsis sp. H20-H5]|uniref:hypothetical protein n=1 Tax=Amycolatopsis sp. H20-H5 TaxID=3046309 RepID=UPI002DB740CD|nr:hypothetical protein [Amycolatopsis sp. H20-H5]MEC3981886.1 hypothetical protein [Amycolatopsis sp. H20-H5]
MTAVLAALLGFVVALAAGHVPVNLFIDIPSGFSLGDLPASNLVDLAIFLGAALFLLIGAVATLFRSLVGAILLVLGSLLAIAGILIESTVAYGLPFGSYFETVFAVKTFAAVDRAIVVVAAPLVLVLAALPVTFRHLRYRRPVLQAYPQARQRQDHVE